MSDVWRVVSKEGKRIFEGTENDARDFIARLFPRLHVEPHADAPSKPDAVLVAPGGTADDGQYHDNGEFKNVADLNKESETESTQESNDDWQAKAAAAGWSQPTSEDGNDGNA